MEQILPHASVLNDNKCPLNRWWMMFSLTGNMLVIQNHKPIEYFKYLISCIQNLLKPTDEYGLIKMAKFVRWSHSQTVPLISCFTNMHPCSLHLLNEIVNQNIFNGSENVWNKHLKRKTESSVLTLCYNSTTHTMSAFRKDFSDIIKCNIKWFEKSINVNNIARVIISILLSYCLDVLKR